MSGAPAAPAEPARRLEIGRRAERLAVSILGLGLGLTGLGFAAGALDLRLPGEDALSDAAARLAPPPAGAEALPVPGATVVLIDDESLARLGERWPIDRRTWARFLGALAPLGPAAVALDAWFESPAPRDGAELALDLADALRDGPLGERTEARTLADGLEKRAVELDPDRRLAAALGAGGRAILGAACLPAAEDVAAPVAPAGLVPVSLPAPAGALGCARLTASHPALAGAATATGVLSVAPDADGIVRRYPYFTRFGAEAYPSLALEVCRQTGPEAAEACLGRAAARDAGLPGLDLRGVGEATAEQPTLRFSDVIEATEGAAPPPALVEALRGRAVFVGVSAQGTRDRVRLPDRRDVPGIYLHAAAYAALRADRFVLREAASARHGTAALVGGVALLGAATLGIESLPAALVLGLGGPLLVAAGCAAGYAAGLWFSPAPALWGLLVLALLRLGFGLARASAARRQAQAIRHAFQHYLSPAVVEALVLEPALLRLGGERRRITAFFSDVQGFTTLSEQISPAELIALLNEVLGEMTDCLLQEGGTIDKYIGDAIVAMFGAPLDQPDHALRACVGALRCQRLLDVLAERRRQAGLAPINVRIGLNTGEALVGNMGSARRFDYTMIGDAVNLAARLEGINSQYGTRILVGEATAEACGEAIVFREVDAVRPKGKTVAVRIFEPIAERGAVSQADQARIEAFAAALAAYRDRRFAEADRVFERLAGEGDGPARVFLERTRAYIASPPPASWDTVYTLTSK